jgi:hypothetical protein
VLGAFELHIKDGQIIGITNYSGHYDPTLSHLNSFIDYLLQMGVDLSNCQIYFKSPKKLGHHFDEVTKNTMNSTKRVLEVDDKGEKLENNHQVNVKQFKFIINNFKLLQDYHHQWPLFAKFCTEIEAGRKDSEYEIPAEKILEEINQDKIVNKPLLFLNEFLITNNNTDNTWKADYMSTDEFLLDVIMEKEHPLIFFKYKIESLCEQLDELLPANSVKHLLQFNQDYDENIISPYEKIIVSLNNFQYKSKCEKILEKIKLYVLADPVYPKHEPQHPLVDALQKACIHYLMMNDAHSDSTVIKSKIKGFKRANELLQTLHSAKIKKLNEELANDEKVLTKLNTTDSNSALNGSDSNAAEKVKDENNQQIISTLCDVLEKFYIQKSAHKLFKPTDTSLISFINHFILKAYPEKLKTISNVENKETKLKHILDSLRQIPIKYPTERFPVQNGEGSIPAWRAATL